jgi:hypothetical protein
MNNEHLRKLFENTEPLPVFCLSSGNAEPLNVIIKAMAGYSSKSVVSTTDFTISGPVDRSEMFSVPPSFILSFRSALEHIDWINARFSKDGSHFMEGMYELVYVDDVEVISKLDTYFEVLMCIVKKGGRLAVDRSNLGSEGVRAITNLISEEMKRALYVSDELIVIKK